MPNHVTNVIEIREGGVLLPVRGPHVIRVLGALKNAPLPDPMGAKEFMPQRAPESVYDSYYAGQLSSPQQDPAAQPFNPRVPSLFITRGGKPEFLKRDV